MNVAAYQLGELTTLATDSALLHRVYEVTLSITSAVDVIHSLADILTATKSDCIPSRYAANVTLAESSSGMRTGQCSELCGSLHGFMAVTRVAM